MNEYLVAVTLYVRRGREKEFQDFESKALHIAAQYEGQLIRAVRLSERALDLEEPFEFHLLSFPTLKAFQQFREDQRYSQLHDQRDAAICRADLVVGADCSDSYRRS